MQKYFLLLGSLLSLVPNVAFASGKADLVNSIGDIYADTGKVITTIIGNDGLSRERKVQTVSNVLKTKHDAAMAAIQNIR